MTIYGPDMGHIWPLPCPYLFPWPKARASGQPKGLPETELTVKVGKPGFPVVLQTSLEKFVSINFGQFLGLDGPYFALLGPLQASLASGLTPSTCGNPVSTQPKQIFDQKYFREFGKIKNSIFRY